MHRPRQHFAEQVEALVAGELATAGFLRQRPGDFRRPIDHSDGVIGIVGLNRGSMDELGGHDILVFVGVEHPRLRDLYCELVPGKFFGGAVQNLAYLLPSRGAGYWSSIPLPTTLRRHVRWQKQSQNTACRSWKGWPIRNTWPHS